MNMNSSWYRSRYFLFLSISLVVGLYSCGNGDRNFEDAEEIPNIQLSGNIVKCNKCQGYGMVQEDMYSQPHICTFCWISTNMRIENGWTGFDGRFGYVDEVFNDLPADYFDVLSWDETYETMTSEDIQRQIDNCNSQIERIQQMLYTFTSETLKTYYSQELIRLQYKVKELENKL